MGFVVGFGLAGLPLDWSLEDKRVGRRTFHEPGLGWEGVGKGGSRGRRCDINHPPLRYGRASPQSVRCRAVACAKRPFSSPPPRHFCYRWSVLSASRALREGVCTSRSLETEGTRALPPASKAAIPPSRKFSHKRTWRQADKAREEEEDAETLPVTPAPEGR